RRHSAVQPFSLSLSSNCCGSLRWGGNLRSRICATVSMLRGHFRGTAHLVCVMSAFLLAVFVSAQHTPPVASISAAPTQIMPPPPNYAFPDDHAYVYAAEWHLITAGTGVVKMESIGTDRKVTATAESQGVVNVIFPVHDRFEAHFDPRTFCSLSIF